MGCRLRRGVGISRLVSDPGRVRSNNYHWIRNLDNEVHRILVAPCSHESRYGLLRYMDVRSSSSVLTELPLLPGSALALSRGIPITSPTFLSNPSLCPDSVIEELFAPSREEGSKDVETIPLLAERINVLRRVSEVLCSRFNGSYLGLIEEWTKQYGEDRTALQLVQMVVEEFADFRDEVFWRGKKGTTAFRTDAWSSKYTGRLT